MPAVQVASRSLDGLNPLKTRDYSCLFANLDAASKLDLDFDPTGNPSSAASNARSKAVHQGFERFSLTARRLGPLLGSRRARPRLSLDRSKTGRQGERRCTLSADAAYRLEIARFSVRSRLFPPIPGYHRQF